MKELSVEEKATRYDNAIKRAKNTIEVNQTIPNIVECVESLFPELKDEIIRNFISNELACLRATNEKGSDRYEELTNAIAWVEKQGKNNMGISEATKQKLEDNLNNALEKETPESCNEFLDKQCEQKPIFEMKTPEESLGIDSETYSKIVDECIYGEQKPIKEHNACEFCEDRYECVSPCSMKLIEEEKFTNKVEPKFKIEEEKWYVCTQTFVLRGKIVVIKGQTYQAEKDNAIKGEDECLFIDKHDGKASDYFRLWTIQDAKDGDVLADEYGIYIFNSFDSLDDKLFICKCAYEYSKKVFEIGGMLCKKADVYPATKEQLDTLMKAMADTGYTFNFEKKELKKIEQKSSWSEGDEKMLSDINDCIKNLPVFYESININGEDKTTEKFICDVINWLKSIKDRVLPQPKQKWSEEDERTYKSIIYSFAHNYQLTIQQQEFVKSLKDRIQPTKEWSEEDNRMCKAIIDNIQAICEEGYFVGNIDSDELIKWLKYLKDRVQPQPKQEWSEDTQQWIDAIIFDYESWYDADKDHRTTILAKINILKSLKERCTWKPSDEQMLAINTAINVLGKGTINGKYLVELLDQIKGL